jgi:hypothetical protein
LLRISWAAVFAAIGTFYSAVKSFALGANIIRGVNYPVTLFAIDASNVFSLATCANISYNMLLYSKVY